MKNLGRRMFRWLAAMSLLVFVATASLWMRSFFIADFVDYSFANGGVDTTVFDVGENWSWCYVGFHRLQFPAQPFGLSWRQDSSDKMSWSWGAVPNQISLPGMHISWGRPISPQNCWIVRISTKFWILLSFSAILPSLWLLRKRGRNAIDGVRCCDCGYDLRATPDRCPECGTVVLKMT